MITTLTVKQEKFAHGVVDGMRHTDAYRTAYDAENMKDATISRKASDLMANKLVLDRINELREKVAKKSEWTREMSVKALIDAYNEGQPSVKVSAVKELNLMHGYNAPQKLDHTSSDGSMSPAKLTREQVEAELIKRGLPITLLE